MPGGGFLKLLEADTGVDDGYPFERINIETAIEALRRNDDLPHAGNSATDKTGAATLRNNGDACFVT